MIQSKHNIIVPIADSEEFFIVNPLHKSADIITSNEVNLLQNKLDPQGDFAAKKYIVDEQVENRAYKMSYLDFIDKREEDETQLFFVPNYSCNFACSYCYQEGYNPIQQALTTEIIDAFFDYVKTQFAGKKTYITVFGGEPLLPSDKQKELISYMVEKSNEAALDLAFVTNGYTLIPYLDILKKGRIREIQVTIDGTKDTHDNRRYLKGKQGTFDTIVEGVDACLGANMPINLRMVVDKENIDNLIEFSRFAIDRGWTSSPLFKTQIGRNYELHFCNSSPDKLFDRASLYRHIYSLVQKHPHIAEFYKPSFAITKYISENGELPTPLFDSCPACKTEWAFDFTGTIYSCTATVGKKGEELGTFYPTVSHNEKQIEGWQNRDVTTIEECKTCDVALICGGGCASVAKNKNGHVNTPDCRPIKELLSLGSSYYFNK
ncbi:MAG: radical SAM protein [Paludibacteraceae bacterium]|nr:radical SAM protein [Paludibacteraceae bacterium]